MFDYVIKISLLTARPAFSGLLEVPSIHNINCTRVKAIDFSSGIRPIKSEEDGIDDSLEQQLSYLRLYSTYVNKGWFLYTFKIYQEGLCIVFLFPLSIAPEKNNRPKASGRASGR